MKIPAPASVCPPAGRNCLVTTGCPTRTKAATSFFILMVSLACLAPTPLIGDPVRWPVNGHYYEFVRASVTWSEGMSASESRTHVDPDSGTMVPGHLATITSAGENAFILEKLGPATANEFAWVAGREPADDGAWRWEAGPETGNIFDVTNDGDAEGYGNWGGIEPNDNKPGEDYLKFKVGDDLYGIASGQWAGRTSKNGRELGP